jgi:hypothetical protein
LAHKGDACSVQKPFFVILFLDPEEAVEVIIKTASVNTDNDMRDNDLRSPNFFDVEKFPEMTFSGKSVKRTGQNTADVTGDGWHYFRINPHRARLNSAVWRRAL